MIYLYLYRFLYCFIILPGFWIASFFNSKIKVGLKMRGNRPWEFESGNSRPIWIHASSMEFEYAKPVIRKLKKLYPQTKIMVTYFSPSAAKVVKSFEGVDFSSPSPWDLPCTMARFLKRHNPRALLLARTDTWPEMLYQCQKRKIPTLLFSATFADSSSRMTTYAKKFFAWTLGLIKEIFVVETSDAKNLSHLGLKNYQLGGDTRYDQVFHRLENGKSVTIPLAPNGVVTFIAGSTWPQDEDVLVPAVKTLIAEKLPIRFILVPHEPTDSHIKALREKFPMSKLYTQSPSAFTAGEVLLVNRVGVLAELYKLAEIAFVGGSFVRNVHSVMEALACGNLTLVGPFHENNREAIAFQKINFTREYTAVSAVLSSAQVANFIKGYLALGPVQRQEIKSHIISSVRSREGASDKVIEWVERNVPV